MKIQPVVLLPRVRLALARLGVVNLLAIVLCVAGSAAWIWGIPMLRSQLQLQQQAITEARKTLESVEETAAKPVRTLTEERLAQFYDSLGEPGYAEQQLKTLFAIAGKNNLALSQAEYKLSYDKNGQFHAYQISLPVKGPYGSIRQFCEQTLLAIPFASLDDMHFKREAIGSLDLEAKLRFTLYLAGEPTQQRLAQEVMGGGHE